MKKKTANSRLIRLFITVMTAILTIAAFTMSASAGANTPLNTDGNRTGSVQNMPPYVPDAEQVRLIVPENATRALAGKIPAQDDEGDSFIYEITGGTAMDLFDIGLTTGEVRMKAGIEPFDYESWRESGKKYTIKVEVSDARASTYHPSLCNQYTFPVSVGDVNDMPYFDYLSEDEKEIRIAENIVGAGGSVKIGDHDRYAEDESFRNNEVVAIGGDTDIFEVSSSGRISVRSGVTLNRKVKEKYELVLRVRDANVDADGDHIYPDLYEDMTFTIKVIVDKTELSNALKNARSYLDNELKQEMYSDIAKVLKEAIKQADSVMEDADTGGKEVSDAVLAIGRALDVAKADKAETDDCKAADEVINMIKLLPAGDGVSLSDKPKIESARKIYDSLNADRKKKVPEDIVKKLVDAEAGLAAAEKQPAKENEPAEEIKAKKEDLAVSAFLKDKKIRVKWNQIPSADGYDLYVRPAGKKWGKPIRTIKNNKTITVALTKLGKKKIDQKKLFEIYVAAYRMIDGKKVVLTGSDSVFIVGAKNGKYTNVKAIKLDRNRLTVKVGKRVKCKAKVTLADKTKKHIPKKYGKELRYRSSDTGIATVDKSGKIRGIGKGKCTVYVTSINGLERKVSVIVEK